MAQAKIFCRSIPKEKSVTSCPKEWAMIRKIVMNKNILLKTWGIKSHSGITGNKLADMADTSTSSALKLGIISQTHFQTALTDAIDITPMYTKPKYSKLRLPQAHLQMR
jgi:hypothetical protein